VLGFNYEIMEAETDSEHDFNEDGDPEITSGLRLPITPAYKASTWAQYSKPTNLFGANDMFIRLQWSFTGDSVNILEPRGLDDQAPQWTNPAYDIGDLRVGFVGEDWQVDVFLNNITDTRAQYTDSPSPGDYGGGNLAEGREHVRSFFVNRPREFGLRFTKRWGG
jgi:outer membrane receptor protein involved in Fe transport